MVPKILMGNTKFILILCLFGFIAEKVFSDVSDKGFRIPYAYSSKEYLVLEKYLAKTELAKHIERVNYKLPKEERELLADEILLVSECLDMDPWFFTGLIQKESSFIKGAVSPTGAAGLTQFTTSGFREVNDQLGLRGKTQANEATIRYYNEQINSCIQSSWIQLWDRVEAEIETPFFYYLLKEEVKNNTLAALVYGAVLLKTHLAYIEYKAETSGAVLLHGENYYLAFMRYNGEEGDAKVRYARGIFKNVQGFYPDFPNFSFLETDKDLDKPLPLVSN